MTTTFRCALGVAMQRCLALRQSLGYQDRTLTSLLAHFDRHLVSVGHADPSLTREIVDAWIAGDGTLKPHSRAARRHAVRVLGRHLALTDPQTYIPPLIPGFRQTSSFRPHIYTPSEIQALLGEAGALTPVGSLRPHTFVTLIGLLACTGVRIAEALALRLADVDLDNGLITILDGKFLAHVTRPGLERNIDIASIRTRRSSSMNGGVPVGTRALSPRFWKLRAGLAFAPRPDSADHVCTTSVTRLPSIDCSRGTAMAVMSRHACRCCRLTWGISA